ncbi:MAG TPA: DUF2834 domain-containing protein [Acetobacteraceae bacterium]|nr:DUF2834 domain-containing protein [Acetobacteraceae bacterium]
MQMVSFVYIALGLVLTAAVFAVNRTLFTAGGVGLLEAAYYVVAAAGLVIGWYFNIRYMMQYGNQAGWVHWTRLLFANPASASGGQDLILANVLIFPLWTVSEARRAGMRAGWLYFPVSLLTSYAFAVALFLAIRERHIRT